MSKFSKLSSSKLTNIGSNIIAGTSIKAFDDSLNIAATKAISFLNTIKAMIDIKLRRYIHSPVFVSFIINRKNDPSTTVNMINPILMIQITYLA
jgi:hypothetical protein